MLIWSTVMLGIKIRTVLKSELKGLHKNIQYCDPRCLGSHENTKNKAQTVLMDTLHIEILLLDFRNTALPSLVTENKTTFETNPLYLPGKVSKKVLVECSTKSLTPPQLVGEKNKK